MYFHFLKMNVYFYANIYDCFFVMWNKGTMLADIWPQLTIGGWKMPKRPYSGFNEPWNWLWTHLQQSRFSRILSPAKPYTKTILKSHFYYSVIYYKILINLLFVFVSSFDELVPIKRLPWSMEGAYGSRYTLRFHFN